MKVPGECKCTIPGSDPLDKEIKHNYTLLHGFVANL